MGVHDYCCIIHSCGEQNIETHPNCVGTHDRCDGDEEDSHDEENKIVGILLCFDLPENITCRNSAKNLLKNGKAKNLRVMKPDEYCWDSWDFIDNGENMGYFSVLNPSGGSVYCDCGCNGQDDPERYTLPWKTSNNWRENHPYKAHFWCMAFCQQCFDIFVMAKKIKVKELCSKYCNSLCDANDLKVGVKFRVYEAVMDKFRWLRKLIEN